MAPECGGQSLGPVESGAQEGALGSARTVEGGVVTPWIVASQVPLPSTLSWSLLKIMSIESVMLSNHLILSCPCLILPSIFPSIRVFSNELALCIKLELQLQQQSFQ